MSGIYIPHKGDVEGAVYMVAVVGGKARLFTYRYGEPHMVYIKDGIIVQGHGRLVDENDIMLQIDEWMDSVGTVMIGHGMSYYGELLGCVEDAPTIIPADKGENDGSSD